jgi:two-component system phosphate regulon response regulator OmpR
MSQHILFVGADAGLTAVVGESLRGQGCGVSARPPAAGLKHVIERERPSLLVLDISAPHGDGLAVLRDLRMSGNDVPVILLSASSKAIDRVIGLELGADDFMSKPADPAELLARIRVLLRRRGTLAPGAPETRPPYRFGRCELNFSARELRRDNEHFALRSSEFALLKIFVNHAMTVLTRVQLNEKLRGNSVLHQGRSLDVSIWRLRRLIEIDPSEPRYVQTVWGRGYVFVPHGELGAAERGVMVAPGV